MRTLIPNHKALNLSNDLKELRSGLPPEPLERRAAQPHLDLVFVGLSAEGPAEPHGAQTSELQTV